MRDARHLEIEISKKWNHSPYISDSKSSSSWTWLHWGFESPARIRDSKDQVKVKDQECEDSQSPIHSSVTWAEKYLESCVVTLDFQLGQNSRACLILSRKILLYYSNVAAISTSRLLNDLGNDVDAICIQRQQQTEARGRGSEASKHNWLHNGNKNTGINATHCNWTMARSLNITIY